MLPIEILVIGRNIEILQTIVRLINSRAEWNGVGVCEDEEAIQLFKTKKIDIVLLGGGIEESSELLLRKTCTQKNPNIVIIQHFGGGSGLLSNEILEALDKKCFK